MVEVSLQFGLGVPASKPGSSTSPGGFEIRYIQPGKPNQNAFIERFNKSYRDEVHIAYLFSTLDQVREITERWVHTYNEYWPHEALGGMPPAMYLKQLKLENSSYELST